MSGLHDLNVAARYADRLVAMKDGAVVGSGAPAEVIPDPTCGTPLVLPLRRPPGSTE